MTDDYSGAIFGLAWILGWLLIFWLIGRAYGAQMLKRREMLHRERLAAIEKGVPLPELPSEEAQLPEWASAEVDRVRALWLLRFSLLLGLVATTTGIGLCLGFYFAPDRGYHGMWTLGLIPLMGGIGFLLYWRIASRSHHSD